MISCSPGNPSGSGAKKSEMVGPMGAAIELEDAVLEIPAGAVPPGTTITITSSTTPAPEEYESRSPVYKFEPEGIEFAIPVRIEMKAPSGGARLAVF
ncbi:MAG TPA: hypothetical protein VGD87_01640, partial [Archangium sp.]